MRANTKISLSTVKARSYTSKRDRHPDTLLSEHTFSVLNERMQTNPSRHATGRCFPMLPCSTSLFLETLFL
jgi:hypothetical protein